MEILKRLAFFMLAENAQVPTSGLSAARQKIRSGAEGIRTPDLLRAREALSQLSYSPTW
jgi:hypothetical protein